jgi:hypothetical protein
MRQRHALCVVSTGGAITAARIGGTSVRVSQGWIGIPEKD